MRFCEETERDPAPSSSGKSEDYKLIKWKSLPRTACRCSMSTGTCLSSHSRPPCFATFSDYLGVGDNGPIGSRRWLGQPCSERRLSPLFTSCSRCSLGGALLPSLGSLSLGNHHDCSSGTMLALGTGGQARFIPQHETRIKGWRGKESRSSCQKKEKGML